MVWERKQKGKENHRDLGLRQVLENRTGCMLHWHIESLHYVQPRMTLFRVTYLCSWSIHVDKWYQVISSDALNIEQPWNPIQHHSTIKKVQILCRFDPNEVRLRPLPFSDILRALCLDFPWSRHKLRSEHWACDKLSPERPLLRRSDLQDLK